MDQQGNSSSVPPKKTNTLVVIGALVIVVVLALVTWEFALKDQSSSPSTVSQEQQSTVPEGSNQVFVDGSYEAVGEYQTPASLEKLDVKVTVANGLVTAASFEGTPDNPTTELMHKKFRDGFEAEVVGKPIDEISLGVVNGSSLTPKGFMDALDKIRVQAQG